MNISTSSQSETLDNNIGIIGYGRFGKLLSTILSPLFKVFIYDSSFISYKREVPTTPHIVEITSLQKIQTCSTIFIAVPIHQFEDCIKNLTPYLTSPTTIIDICSVKVHPVNIMLKYLPEHVDIIATHPLFGPDSINNLSSRKIMMNHIRGTVKTYDFWKTFFQNQNMTIMEMTPDEHDKLAAQSQSITHFIGRVLEDANIHTTGIDTQGFEKLLTIKQQTLNDSWELFYDLQRYNPYSKEYINQLITSVNRIYEKIK